MLPSSEYTVYCIVGRREHTDRETVYSLLIAANWTRLTNPTKRQTNIPQCTICKYNMHSCTHNVSFYDRNVHAFLLQNGALLDMGWCIMGFEILVYQLFLLMHVITWHLLTVRDVQQMLYYLYLILMLSDNQPDHGVRFHNHVFGCL